uniref:BACK domain-containing protein n=1 Tax=Timema poppense TaxID=170557 RepID=A0A7R9CWC2_TIMPO|nr:unnamed protein product [Timema poppensis]
MSTLKDDVNKKVNVKECSPQKTSLMDVTDTQHESLDFSDCINCKEKNSSKPKADNFTERMSSNSNEFPDVRHHVYVGRLSQPSVKYTYKIPDVKNAIHKHVSDTIPYAAYPQNFLPSELETSNDDDDRYYEKDGTCEIRRDKIYLKDCKLCPSRDIYAEEVDLAIKPSIYEMIHRFLTNRNKADCSIIVHGTEFRCIKLVLQCYSRFFEEREMGDLIELNVSSVSSSAFGDVYEWMMTLDGDFHKILRRDNIFDVFTAASFLGVSDLEEQCWCLFNCDETFQEDTAYLLLVEAMSKSNSVIVDMMLPRVNKFFLSLVSSKDFINLPVDLVITILNSKHIAIYNEIEVFMAATRWLMYDWERRISSVENVMRCVRFGNIFACQLLDMRRNPDNPEFLEIMSIPEVDKMVDEGLSYAVLMESHGQTPYHEGFKFKEWIKALGCDEPTPRNYANGGKRFLFYSEFLQELETYKFSVLKMMRESIIKCRKERYSINNKTIPLELPLVYVNNHEPQDCLAPNCIDPLTLCEHEAKITSPESESKQETSSEERMDSETSSPHNDITTTQNTPGSSSNTSSVPTSEAENVPATSQKDDKAINLNTHTATSVVCKSKTSSAPIIRETRTVPVVSRSHPVDKYPTMGVRTRRFPNNRSSQIPLKSPPTLLVPPGTSLRRRVSKVAGTEPKSKNNANISSHLEALQELKGVVIAPPLTRVTRAKHKPILPHQHRGCCISSESSYSTHTSMSEQLSPQEKQEGVNFVWDIRVCTSHADVLETRKVEVEGSVPKFEWKKSGKPFRENHPKYTQPGFKTLSKAVQPFARVMQFFVYRIPSLTPNHLIPTMSTELQEYYLHFIRVNWRHHSTTRTYAHTLTHLQGRKVGGVVGGNTHGSRYREDGEPKSFFRLCRDRERYDPVSSTDLPSLEVIRPGSAWGWIKLSPEGALSANETILIFVIRLYGKRTLLNQPTHYGY